MTLIRLAGSCLIVLSLVLASCASAVPEEEVVEKETAVSEISQEEGSQDIPTGENKTSDESIVPTTEAQESSSGYILDMELCFQDSQIEIYHITYMSDGLKVKGYLAQPKVSGIYPAIIYNRGGNREYGKLSCSSLKVYASHGFVAVGSQYRGNDGGEGKEEFGGEDVSDILNLIPVLKSLPNVNADKIGMVGGSRGGMMTYLALKEQTLTGMDDIKVACTVGGIADLFISAENREEMLNGVFIPLIGGTPSQLPKEYEARSATYWADKINVPLLIQHGEADWRVSVDEARKLAEELERYGKNHKLITYPGDDHGLSLHNRGLYETFSWLSQHLDVSIDLQDVAIETPDGLVEIVSEGSYFEYEEKGYRVAAPSEGWVARVPAPPLDVLFMKMEGTGAMGVGAFSGDTYTITDFNSMHESWVSNITAKMGATDVNVLEKDSLIIAEHNTEYVTFEYTSDGKRYIETTYHIWQPTGEYKLYRIRVFCLKDSYDEFQGAFENFVNSFTFSSTAISPSQPAPVAGAAPVKLVAPVGNVVIETLTPTIEWNPSLYAVSYTVRLYNVEMLQIVPTGTNAPQQKADNPRIYRARFSIPPSDYICDYRIFHEESDIKDTFYVIPEDLLEWDKTYVYSVDAINKEGESSTHIFFGGYEGENSGSHNFFSTPSAP